MCLTNLETLQTLSFIGLPWWLSSKESACNAGDPGSIPGQVRSRGRSPGGEHGTPVSLPGEFPWTEEPGGLQFIVSQRVRHDLATKHIGLGSGHRALVEEGLTFLGHKNMKYYFNSC